MKKLIIGNWKMNLGLKGSLALARALKGLKSKNEVGVCPSDFALAGVKAVLGKSQIKLGAQNCFWEASGAYTGQTSAASLKELGCAYVILGHSELRALGESCRRVNLKAKAALARGLTPVICVGEDWTKYKAGKSRAFVSGQIKRALAGLKLGGKQLVIAYEPLWAIGSGRPLQAEAADATQAFIKSEARKALKQPRAAVAVLYGGSVNAANAKNFLRQGNIDGLLIGGASLKAQEFKKIAETH